MIISTDTEVSDDVQQRFKVNRLGTVRRAGSFLSQEDSKKTTTNTTLRNSDRTLSSTGQEQHRGCVLTQLSCNTVLKIPGRAINSE